MADQPKTADDVQGLRRRARHPLRPALVHRHPRPAQELLDQRGGARRRVRGRHGLRRLVDHRLQRDRGVGHDRDARRRRRSRCCPGGPRTRAWRACSATSSRPSREPYEGDPRHVLRRALERAEDDGLRHLQRRPRARVLLLPQRQPRTAPPGDPRRGRLLRPHDARRRLGRPPRDRARARGARHPRGVHPPRGRALAARDRHALRRRAEDGRRLHDLPHHGQGVRHEVRLARDLHAQAAVRRERLGDAHPPVAVQGRAATPSTTPTTSTSCPTSARRSSPASSSTRARSRRSSPSGSTPTSGSCPATRRRSTAPGRAATARRWCACRSTTPARSRRRGWSCAAPTPPATPT